MASNGENSKIQLRVLVCDDEPGMRIGVARALRDFVVSVPDITDAVLFEVEHAESGEEAIEKVEARTPHILLLDHKLPGMTGLDVLDRIESSQSDMLTIMMTAYASIETAVRATKQGAYDFLAKPFTPAELRNAVRKAAEHVVVAQQARRLAQEKRQVRFQFISVLAHELQAPLGAVQGYLDVLKDRPAGVDAAACEHMIDRCRNRMLFMRKMIGDLLDLTRIESGQRRREVCEFDVCAAARTAMETVSAQAAEQEVEVTLHAERPVLMTGDASEIEIVLNNLLTNAVKYNKRGGRVDVMVAEAGDEVVIEVADTGIGMTDEEAGRLFKEFVRIKNKKTRHILGSGLGLSIVKRLAQLYGGSVSVKSEPDAGTTFRVAVKKEVPGEAK